jgi:hypothetical protein
VLLSISSRHMCLVILKVLQLLSAVSTLYVFSFRQQVQISSLDQRKNDVKEEVHAVYRRDVAVS